MSIGQRKADHLDICRNEDVGFKTRGTLLEDVRLLHDALPDMAETDIDTRVSVFGKTLRAPLLIASMTGGTDEAAKVNRELASIAEERGYAFGVGSQRAMHVRKESLETYRVRDVAKATVVLGNLGLVQARSMKSSEITDLAAAIGADALCLHLNPAMELIQPGGDRDFSAGLETIARVVAECGVPVVVKETGCGISPSVAERVAKVGVKAIDVSGAGGTSWVGVETIRAAAAGDEASRDLGTALWDWGIPTAASIGMLRRFGLFLFATGGIATGLDVARAIALGAGAAGIARGVLKALNEGGREGALRFMGRIESELRAAMLLTGSRDIAALGRAPRVIVGELRHYLTDS